MRASPLNGNALNISLIVCFCALTLLSTRPCLFRPWGFSIPCLRSSAFSEGFYEYIDTPRTALDLFLAADCRVAPEWQLQQWEAVGALCEAAHFGRSGRFAGREHNSITFAAQLIASLHFTCGESETSTRSIRESRSTISRRKCTSTETLVCACARSVCRRSSSCTRGASSTATSSRTTSSSAWRAA